MPNPFSVEKTEKVVDRASVQQILETYDIDTSVYDVFVIDKDTRILDFESVPKSEHLIIRCVPKGDTEELGIGSMILGGLMILGGAALAIFVPGIGLTIGVALIGTGVSLLAGGFVMYNSDLIGGAPGVNSDMNRPDPAPSIRGGKNRARTGARVPILLGKHLIVPDHAALPYTHYKTNDQYLHQLFCAGYEDIDIDTSTIKIGENPITNFSNVDYEEQRGASAVNSYYLARRIDVSVSSKVTTANLVKRTPTNTYKIIVLFSLPRGIGQYNSQGDLGSHRVTIHIEYSEVGSGVWTALTGSSVTINGQSEDTQRVVRSKTLDNLTAAGADYVAGRQYDVRIRLDEAPNEGSKYLEDVYWDVLQAETGIFDDAGAVDTRPILEETQEKLTLLGIAIKATDQLNGTIEQLSFIGELECREYSGSGTGTLQWTVSKTRNPAAMFLYVLQSEYINRKPVDDDNIDWVSLEAWWDFCDTKGFECNAHITGEYTIEQLLNHICSTGRASWNLLDNKYTIVIDDTKSTVSQYFTPRNSWGFQGQKSFSDKPTTLKLQFVDAGAGYVPTERLVSYNTTTELVEYDTELAGLTQEVPLFGVTDGEQAAKIGAYQLAVSYLRPELYAFNVDIEYLISTRGDRVQVTHDVPLFGLDFGRIRTVVESGGNTTGFIADEAVTFQDGVTYGVTIRKNDGTGVTKEVVNPSTGDDVLTNEINFSSVLAGTGVLHGEDLFMFGESGEETRDLIIIEITPGENAGEAKIVCVDYSSGIFSADGGVIPTYDPGISQYAEMTAQVVTRMFDSEGVLIDLLQEAGVIDGTSLTHEEDANGYEDSLNNMSASPETPIWDDWYADKQDAHLRVLPQTVGNGYTANISKQHLWEWQVSDDEDSWYSLKFDGTDWKDTLDAHTAWPLPSIFHTNIPNVVSGVVESARTLYYRVRLVTFDADGTRNTESSYSLTKDITTQPVTAWNETIPPLNGAITNLSGDEHANVTVTFTVGDDSHGGSYAAGEYSGLAGHKIYRRINGTGADVRLVGDVNDPSQTTFEDTTSQDGVTYDYGIAAYDVNGNLSTITWYGTPVTPQYTAAPDDVTGTEATAYPKQIVLEWDQISRAVSYTLEKSTDSGSNWDPLASGIKALAYVDVIAEVEYSTLSGVRYRVKAVDEYGNPSDNWDETASAPTRDDSYGTWSPEDVTAATIKVSASNRNISIQLDSQGADTPADYTDDLIDEYGFRVQISNDGGSTWYKPNLEASGATGADRWYTGSVNDYLDVPGLTLILNNLPLTNEASPPVSNETYTFRVKRLTDGGDLSSSWYQFDATVTATGARDVVENALTQATMDMDDWLILDEAGLEAFWSLNDVAQDTVSFKYRDNSGNGGDATGSQLLTSAAGKAGPCVDFGGTVAEYITATDPLGTSAPTEFSVSVWFALTPDSDLMYAVHRGPTALIGDSVYMIGLNSSDNIIGAVNGEYANGITGITAVAGQWYHVVLTYDGSVQRVYVNGVLKVEYTTGAITNDASDGLVGIANAAVAQNAARSADGKIQHVRIYSRELNQGEVRWLYQNPSGNVPEMFLSHRAGFGSILAEHLSVLSKNLINNVSSSGHLGGWGQHDETGLNTGTTNLSLATPTYGSNTITTMRVTSSVTWGVRSRSFRIDHSKIYRVQWTVKRQSGDGTHYMGVNARAEIWSGAEAAGSNMAGGLDVGRYIASTRELLNTGNNVYFVYALSHTSWTTLVSYIVGYDRDVDDCPDTKGTGYIVKLLDETTKYVNLRFLLWTPSVATEWDIANITVEEVGSGTIVAENINVENLAAISANLGAITDGSMEADSNNYWALDDTSLAGHVKGDFRIGNATSFLKFDAAASELSMKLDSIYVASLTTRVKGTLEIGDAGELETGLTDPLEIFAEGTGSRAVLEHPTQLDFRINGTNIAQITAASGLHGDVYSMQMQYGYHVTSGSYRYFSSPPGAWYTSDANPATGAIKIALPVLSTSDMIRFVVDIFCFRSTDAALQSMTLYISGYNYAVGPNWINTRATAVVPYNAAIPTVRFGYDANSSCVWIGEITDSWYYPKITIRDATIGYSPNPAWLTGAWTVSIETSYDTVTNTISAGLVVPGLAYDQDVDVVAARTALHSTNYADYAFISHIDLKGTSNAYALLQASDGTTLFNAASAKDIYFRIANSSIMRMNEIGLYVGGGTDPTYTLQVGGTFNQTGSATAATGDETLASFNFTVNKATSGNVVGVLIDVTDTASPAALYPFQVKVDGSEVFRVNEGGGFYTTGSIVVDGGITQYDGSVLFQQSDANTFEIEHSSDPDLRWYMDLDIADSIIERWYGANGGQIGSFAGYGSSHATNAYEFRINASNGSGVLGLDSNGTIELAIDSTVRQEFDSSGNISFTPGSAAIDFVNKTAAVNILLTGNTSGQGYIASQGRAHYASNAYHDGTDWRSIAASPSGAAVLAVGNSSGTYFSFYADTSVNAADEALSGTEVLALGADGGFRFPNRTWHYFQTSDGSTGEFAIGTDPSGAYEGAGNLHILAYSDEWSTALTINELGGVKFFTEISVDGAAEFGIDGDLGYGYGFSINNSNQVLSPYIRADTTSSSANVYIATGAGRMRRSTSSARYKDDIKRPADDWSSPLLSVIPKDFFSKGDQRRFLGLIAEEVAAVLPDAVQYDEEGRPDAIEWNTITACLLNEVRKLRAELDELKAEVA